MFLSPESLRNSAVSIVPNSSSCLGVLTCDFTSTGEMEGCDPYSFPAHRPLVLPSTLDSPTHITVTRVDSDLEAFSHNPTDGSFTALGYRLTVCTKCPDLRFLSYLAGLLTGHYVHLRLLLNTHKW